mgnify:CR=1 FL=1|tara:strand:+ start:1127 stop:1660 length:534 start_codon:yes stop_codon:yes gene_type:complete
MKLNLFSIPIWIGNIDAQKIIINEENLQESFASKLKTSVISDGNIEPESLEYLYSVVVKLLSKEVLPRYKLDLEHIWVNHYRDSDYQEQHAHAGTHLSFIIYKKIDKSNVVFSNPNATAIESYYYDDESKINLFGGYSFRPQCRENQIILFPSYLEHFVKKTSDAISIAGNLYMNFE